MCSGHTSFWLYTLNGTFIKRVRYVPSPSRKCFPTLTLNIGSASWSLSFYKNLVFYNLYLGVFLNQLCGLPNVRWRIPRLTSQSCDYGWQNNLELPYITWKSILLEKERYVLTILIKDTPIENYWLLIKILLNRFQYPRPNS